MIIMTVCPCVVLRLVYVGFTVKKVGFLVLCLRQNHRKNITISSSVETAPLRTESRWFQGAYIWAARGVTLAKCLALITCHKSSDRERPPVSSEGMDGCDPTFPAPAPPFMPPSAPPKTPLPTQPVIGRVHGCPRSGRSCP
jgi:hypothetical protein